MKHHFRAHADRASDNRVGGYFARWARFRFAHLPADPPYEASLNADQTPADITSIVLPSEK
jgi:hypothetical protein